jgi:hypothetical protein
MHWKRIGGRPNMSRRKPTDYLDTNVPSILHYRGSNIAALHQQMLTRQWWESERKWFRVLASTFTEGEMNSTSNKPVDVDEVERCRRVRRALEQTHGDLDGLCDWIEALQQEPTAKRSSRVGGKPSRARSQTTRRRRPGVH